MSIEVLEEGMRYHNNDLLTKWFSDRLRSSIYSIAIDAESRSEFYDAEYYFKLQVL